MTLNISFLFLARLANRQQQQPAARTTIVYHYVNMTVKFIFVWSSGKEANKREKEL
jgi:hypothetical protein